MSASGAADGPPATAPLRVGLAAVASLDALALAYALAGTTPGPRTHPLAPRALLALGHRPALLAPLAAACVLAWAQFARRRAPVATGAAGLALLGVMCEAHAALVGGPMRVFFSTGACAAGWLFGLLFARGAQGARARALARALTPAREEPLAAAGAAGALAGTYAGAALSKALATGVGWFDAANLQAVVACHHPVDEGGALGAYARAVIAHGGLAALLAAATLVIQAGAPLWLLSRRTRAVWGALLVGFHLNVFALTHILFAQAIALITLFSVPWRARSPAVDDGAPPRPVAPHARRAAIVAACAIAAVAALARLPPVRAYTALHHRAEDAPPAVPAPAPLPPREPARADAEVRAWLGGLDAGDALAGARVLAVRARRDEAAGPALELELASGATRFALTVVPRGAAPAGRPAPRQTACCALYWGHLAPPGAALDPAARDAALDALAARIAASEARGAPLPRALAASPAP